jgi:hypothetical protein
MSNDNPFGGFSSKPPIGGRGNEFFATGIQPSANVHRPPSTSIAAIFSLIASLCGLVTCCCAPISGPLALIGVVLGHVSLWNIHRSQGRVQGKTVAILGCAAGYFSLLICAALLAYSLFGPKVDPADVSPAALEKLALDRAESLITTDSNGVAQGNSPKAIALARDFSTTMKRLREELFTKRKETDISLSGDQFVTYCELHEGKCAFVVHVPAYKKFDDDAKESLAELAWAAAQKTVRGTLDEGDELAVGMKGVLLYGKVMVGEVVHDPDGLKDGIEKESKSSEQWLLPFFKTDSPVEPAPLPAETPKP